MSSILITGITGYIGSRLAKSLLNQHRVFGLVREPLHTEYVSDILDRLTLLPYDGSYGSMERALRECRPELTYHLATHYTGGHGAVETPALVSANVVMGAYLLEAMATVGAKPLVYATTVMANYQGEAYRPLNLYAATKKAFSDLLAYYTDAGTLRAVTLALSDTYGGGDHRPKALNLIRRAAFSGERIAFSDGAQDYDALYIDDVVRAFHIAGERVIASEACNETFQLIPERLLTLRETVELMLSINGWTADVGWGERPMPERMQRRAVRIYPNLPRWRQETPLEEGLAHLRDF